MSKDRDALLQTIMQNMPETNSYTVVPSESYAWLLETAAVPSTEVPGIRIDIFRGSQEAADEDQEQNNGGIGI